MVLFFSQSPDQWTGPSRYGGTGRLDQNGRYSMRSLPPGDYLAVAVDAIDNARRVNDPRQFYDDLSRDAVRVTLREGETKALDLKLTIRQ